MLVARVVLPRCLFTQAFLPRPLALPIARVRARHFSTPRAHIASNDEVKVKVRIGLKEQVNLV